MGDLYAPIGGSMSGFAGRAGPRHPYALAMGASTGYIDRPNVKALALASGEERVVIARLSMAGVSEVLYRKVLTRVREISGADLTGRLWLSATHSHSGPAHSLPIPIPLSYVGADTFDQGFTGRLADSIARAVRDSLERLEPAALDTTVVTPFDPSDTWSCDRRCNHGPPAYKEDRLFLARVDRRDGSPLAALISFPVHGVWMKKTLMSSDVPGAIEHGFQKTFDRPVEALFLQGPAGDVNPSATPHGHTDEQGLEWFGRSVGPVLRSVFDGLQPTAGARIGMATLPIQVSREAIGYAEREFGWVDPLTSQFHPYEEGAFYCGSPEVWSQTSYFTQRGSIVDCADPSTRLLDGYYGCVLPLPFLPAWWTWAMNPTEVADLRLGDTLLSLMPGELTGLLSRRLRLKLHEATGIADDRIATFGYSNGYQSYLLTESDWLQGGYETSTSMWGPRYGDWLVDANVELARALLSPTPVPVHPEPPLPDFPDPDLLPVGFEAGLEVGTTLAPVEPAYRRFETVSFSWAGGFTGADSHRVSFEKQVEGAFTQLLLPDGRPLTDAGMETVLRYRPSPDYSQLWFPARRRHRYTVSWELTADVPPGRYRIRVEGTNWDGTRLAPYQVISEPFEVLVSDAVLVRNLEVRGEGSNRYRIACDAFWPPNPEGTRLRHPDFGPEEWSPVTGGQATATILSEGTPSDTLVLSSVAAGHFEGTCHLTRLGGDRHVVIRAHDLQDAFGNTNAADAGPAPFPHSD